MISLVYAATIALLKIAVMVERLFDEKGGD